MSEYIDRGKLMAFPIRRDHCDRKNANEHFINGIESVLEYAENLPTADVVPIIRCEKCRHKEMIWGFPYCTLHEHDFMVHEDSFCSWGTPREEMP